MALACAAFFYKAGENETGSGVWFAGMSIVISAAILMLFGGGVLAVLLGQLGLLIAITLYRVWRDPR